MAVAGTVQIDFAAETAKFTAELKKVRGELGGLRSQVDGFSNSIATIGKTLLTGAAVAGFANFVRGAADAADQLGNTADRLGIAVERLQDFQFAAADANVSFDTLTATLSTAQRRLGEAAAGSGEAAKWIKALGLNVSELRSLSADELFLRYSDAIRGLAERGQQAAAAQALLGKQSGEALNIILNGREILDAAAQQVDALGIRLTELDIRQIQIANDQFDKLKLAAQAAGARIAVALAPYVIQLGNQFFATVAQGDRLSSVIESIVRVGVIGFNLLRNGVLVLDAAVSAVVFGMAKLFETAVSIATFVPRLFLAASQALASSVGNDEIAAKIQSARDGIANVQQFIGDIAANAAARTQDRLSEIRSIAQIVASIDATISAARAAAGQNVTGGTGTGGTGTVSIEKDDPITAEMRALEERLAAANASRIEREIEQEAEKNLRKLEGERDFIDAKERLARESSEREQEFRTQTAEQALSVLSFLTSRSKSANKALETANKIRAVRETIQSTRAAAAKAISIYGPTPQGFAAAAAAIAYGAVQLRAILSDGGDGNGSLSGGGSSPALSTQQDVEQQQATGASQRPQGQIIVNGNIFSSQETADYFIGVLREAFNSYDTVVIGPNSRQAIELRGG
jgi:hypothetical protein